MRVNNSKNVRGYIKIHRKHIGKTIVVHNLHRLYFIGYRARKSRVYFMRFAGFSCRLVQ